MKITNTIYQHKKALMIAVLTLLLSGFKTYAQHISGNGTESDTVTYVLYNNDLSFDSKRTLVFNDKHSVDSAVNVLAQTAFGKYHIIYQKEGKQAQTITPQFLKTLDKTGIYRLTIAYNKPDLADDNKPLYIIRSK